MNKRLLFLALLLPFLVNCSPQKKENNKPEIVVKKVEKLPETVSGWTSPHTFRITSVGAPDTSLTNKLQRKESAKDNALLKAKRIIIKVFVKAKLESLQKSDPTLAYMSVKKQFSGVIENGKIISTEYSDNDNCKLVYEVESRNLRKKVEGK